MAIPYQILIAENEYKLRLTTFLTEAEKHLRYLFHHPKYGNFQEDEKVMAKAHKKNKLNYLRSDQRALVLPRNKKTDSKTFDITILCYFFLHHTKLAISVKQDIEGVRSERNWVVHTPNITYDEFQKRWNAMKVFLNRLGYDINIIEELKSGKLCDMEQFQVSINKSNIEMQGHDVTQIKSGIEQNKSDITYLKERLDELEHPTARTRSATDVSITEVQNWRHAKLLKMMKSCAKKVMNAVRNGNNNYTRL